MIDDASKTSAVNAAKSHASMLAHNAGIKYMPQARHSLRSLDAGISWHKWNTSQSRNKAGHHIAYMPVKIRKLQ